MTDSHEQYDAAERALVDTLEQRSPAPGHPDLSGIYGRARGIRRRRTAAVGLAAAAIVAAVAVPLALADGPGTDSAPPITTQSPSPSPAPTAAPSTGESGNARPAGPLSRLRVGEAPAIDYAVGDTWVNTDGSTQRLPTAGILAITPYHGGFLVLTDQQSGETGRLVQYDADGQVSTAASAGAPVVSPDIYNPFWTTVDGQTTIHTGIASGMSDAERQQTVPHVVRLVGLLPDGRVVYTDNIGFEGAWATDLDSPPTKLPTLDSATSASPVDPLVAGIVNDATSSSSAVVNVSTGTTLWTTSAGLGRFSPDGQLIVGRDEGSGELGLYDAHSGGDPRCTAPQLSGLDTGMAQWEDGSHLLVPATDQRGDNAIVRVGLPNSGTRCTVQRAKTPDDLSAKPYVLALQP